MLFLKPAPPPNPTTPTPAFFLFVLFLCCLFFVCSICVCFCFSNYLQQSGCERNFQRAESLQNRVKRNGGRRIRKRKKKGKKEQEEDKKEREKKKKGHLVSSMCFCALLKLFKLRESFDLIKYSRRLFDDSRYIPALEQSNIQRLISVHCALSILVS